MAPAVRQTVQELLGGDPDSDQDILEYIITCLEDESFEFGKDGQGVFDTVGMMLVRPMSTPR
jgi:hypothetical protein